MWCFAVWTSSAAFQLQTESCGGFSFLCQTETLPSSLLSAYALGTDVPVGGDSSLGVGAYVGIVVGLSSFIALAVWLLWWFCRRRSQQRKHSAALHSWQEAMLSGHQEGWKFVVSVSAIGGTIPMKSQSFGVVVVLGWGWGFADSGVDVGLDEGNDSADLEDSSPAALDRQHSRQLIPSGVRN